MILTLAMPKTIFQGQFLLQMRALRNRSFLSDMVPAIIVYSVVGDMYMRDAPCRMSGYKELCVPYAHPFHVFQSYFCHNPAGQPAFILFGKSQCNVSDRSGYFRIHSGLCFESLCYCGNILNEQAGICDNPGILFIVNDIVGNLTESAAFYNLLIIAGYGSEVLRFLPPVHGIPALP